MDEEYKISRDKAVQAHWDSFFKVLAPQSSVIKKLAKEAFGLERELGAMSQMPSDLASRRVAAALHLKRPFKELRPDGVFKSQNSNPLVGFEYQSTHNVGMGIRAFLYQEAFDENHRDLIPADGMRFVILYSGRDAPRTFREKQHLTVTKQSVEYVYIDLEQVDAQKLETDGIYSTILRLARPDATDFRAFEHAWVLVSTQN
jgi:hypothetical protein